MFFLKKNNHQNNMIYKKFDEIIQFTYNVIKKHEILTCCYLET
jgi:hypothetical protein